MVSAGRLVRMSNSFRSLVSNFRCPASREWHAKRRSTCALNHFLTSAFFTALQSHKACHTWLTVISSLHFVNRDMLVCSTGATYKICRRSHCSLAVTTVFTCAGSTVQYASQPKLTLPCTWEDFICSLSASSQAPITEVASEKAPCMRGLQTVDNVLPLIRCTDVSLPELVCKMGAIDDMLTRHGRSSIDRRDGLRAVLRCCGA